MQPANRAGVLPAPHLNGSHANGSGSYPNEEPPQMRHPNPIFPQTEIGNADRLVYHHGDNLRYCYQAKRWYVWDGTRWAEDDSGEIDRCAENVVQKIWDEAASAENDELRAKLGKWYFESTRNRKIKDFIERAQSKLPVKFEHFDTDPLLLNLANGTLDLRTGQLKPHTREDYLTKIIPIVYDPKAECPNWILFLYRVLNGKSDLMEYLQSVVGYTLTGLGKEQVLFILFGTGANGKSTFLDIISALLADYATQMDSDTLAIKQPGGIQNDIARLRGARFVSASETEEGRRLAESKVKQMTGGDRLVGCFKFQEPFEFIPQFKIFLATNHKPVVRGTDNAIWRRIRMIPFTVTIPEEERDHELPAKLHAELPGILNWALEGCMKWQQDGLGLPPDVKAATESYRAEMDALKAFLEEHCVVAEDATCTKSDVYKAFRRWAEDSGEYVMSQKALGQRLAERGFEEYRTGKSRGWKGLRVLGEQESLLD